MTDREKKKKGEQCADCADKKNEDCGAANDSGASDSFGENSANAENADIGADGEKSGAGSDSGSAAGGADSENINEKYLRLMADFQNQRKRFDKEKADIYQYANEGIVKNLLGVLDNFDRALDAAGDSDAKLVEGMELILKQLWEALEKAGVSEIKALGEDFDPNYHNAVMMEDSSEHASGKVSEVLQKGYILNGRVIRPSMVKVAN